MEDCHNIGLNSNLNNLITIIKIQIRRGKSLGIDFCTRYGCELLLLITV